MSNLNPDSPTDEGTGRSDRQRQAAENLSGESDSPTDGSSRRRGRRRGGRKRESKKACHRRKLCRISKKLFSEGPDPSTSEILEENSRYFEFDDEDMEQDMPDQVQEVGSGGMMETKRTGRAGQKRKADDDLRSSGDQTQTLHNTKVLKPHTATSNSPGFDFPIESKTYVQGWNLRSKKSNTSLDVTEVPLQQTSIPYEAMNLDMETDTSSKQMDLRRKKSQTKTSLKRTADGTIKPTESTENYNLRRSRTRTILRTTEGPQHTMTSEDTMEMEEPADNQPRQIESFRETPVTSRTSGLKRTDDGSFKSGTAQAHKSPFSSIKPLTESKSRVDLRSSIVPHTITGTSQESNNPQLAKDFWQKTPERVAEEDVMICEVVLEDFAEETKPTEQSSSKTPTTPQRGKREGTTTKKGLPVLKIRNKRLTELKGDEQKTTETKKPERKILTRSSGGRFSPSSTTASTHPQTSKQDSPSQSSKQKAAPSTSRSKPGMRPPSRRSTVESEVWTIMSQASVNYSSEGSQKFMEIEEQQADIEDSGQIEAGAESTGKSYSWFTKGTSNYALRRTQSREENFSNYRTHKTYSDVSLVLEKMNTSPRRSPPHLRILPSSVRVGVPGPHSLHVTASLEQVLKNPNDHLSARLTSLRLRRSKSEHKLHKASTSSNKALNPKKSSLQ